jgi:hypothetical protein
VNKLYLLKGGNSLGLVTDGFLGREMTYRMNLSDTSFTRKRIDRVATVKLVFYEEFLSSELANIS